MTMIIERSAPYAATAVWMVIWYFVFCQVFPAQPAGLLAATGTAAAVIVGFLTTANAILLSLVNTEIFQRLAKGGYTHLFHIYFYEAIVAAMAFLVVSVVGFFLSDDNARAGLFPFVWMLFAAASFFLFIRINHLLFSLVSQAK